MPTNRPWLQESCGLDPDRPSQPVSSHNDCGAAEGKTPQSTLRFPGRPTGCPTPLQQPRGTVDVRKTFAFVLPQGRRMRRWRKAGWHGENTAQGRNWWTRLKTIKAKEKPPSSPAESPRARGNPPAGEHPPALTLWSLAGPSLAREQLPRYSQAPGSAPRLSTPRWPFPAQVPAGWAPPPLLTAGDAAQGDSCPDEEDAGPHGPADAGAGPGARVGNDGASRCSLLYAGPLGARRGGRSVVAPRASRAGCAQTSPKLIMCTA